MPISRSLVNSNKSIQWICSFYKANQRSIYIFMKSYPKYIKKKTGVLNIVQSHLYKFYVYKKILEKKQLTVVC